MAASEQFVPLNDERPLMKRSDSMGSGSDVDLAAKGEGLEYRIQALDKKKKGKVVSLWHDISLVHMDPVTDQPTPYMNFVCEIPKFTRKKYEISTTEEGTPIKQDEKKGVLREVSLGVLVVSMIHTRLVSHHDSLHSYLHSSKRAISSSIMAAFLKPGKIPPTFIPTAPDAGATTIHWTFARLVRVSSSRVAFVRSRF
jgi:hypothetical protein